MGAAHLVHAANGTFKLGECAWHPLLMSRMHVTMEICFHEAVILYVLMQMKSLRRMPWMANVHIGQQEIHKGHSLAVVCDKF